MTPPMPPEDNNNKFESPEEQLQQEEVQVQEPVLQESQTVEITPAEKAELVAEVSAVDRKVYGGMYGLPEIVGLVACGLVLFGVIAFYFFALVPAERELKAKRTQRDEMEIKLKNSEEKFKNFTTDHDFAVGLVQSAINFESDFLPLASFGRTSLYDRINGLMAAYNLRNTAGPEYAPLKIKEFRTDKPQEERGRAKFETLFPGDYINMTIEGPYVNIRRFIREIEASRQFVVISTVELETAENKQAEVDNTRPPAQPQNPPGGMGPNGPIGGGPNGQQARPSGPKGKTHGEIVSLHMELAAYYKRESAPATAGQ